MRKTGTDQNGVQELTNQLTKKPSSKCQQQSISDSIEGRKIGQKRELGDYHKSINAALLGTKKEALSAIDTDRAFIEADGGRTRNLRIDSPMVPVSKDLQNQGLTENAAANCKKLAKKSADQAQNIPPELAQIIDRWPSLPEHIRAAVMALIHTVEK